MMEEMIMNAAKNVWGVVTSHDSFFTLACLAVRFKEKGGMKRDSAWPGLIGFFISTIPSITTHYTDNRGDM